MTFNDSNSWGNWPQSRTRYTAGQVTVVLYHTPCICQQEGTWSTNTNGKQSNKGGQNDNQEHRTIHMQGICPPPWTLEFARTRNRDSRSKIPGEARNTCHTPADYSHTGNQHSSARLISGAFAQNEKNGMGDGNEPRKKIENASLNIIQYLQFHGYVKNRYLVRMYGASKFEIPHVQKTEHSLAKSSSCT